MKIQRRRGALILLPVQVRLYGWRQRKKNLKQLDHYGKEYTDCGMNLGKLFRIINFKKCRNWQNFRCLNMSDSKEMINDFFSFYVDEYFLHYITSDLTNAATTLFLQLSYRYVFYLFVCFNLFSVSFNYLHVYDEYLICWFF